MSDIAGRRENRWPTAGCRALHGACAETEPKTKRLTLRPRAAVSPGLVRLRSRGALRRHRTLRVRRFSHLTQSALIFPSLTLIRATTSSLSSSKLTKHNPARSPFVRR